jgi:hypothetical protein
MSHDYVVLVLCVLGLLQVSTAIGLVLFVAIERIFW